MSRSRFWYSEFQLLLLQVSRQPGRCQFALALDTGLRGAVFKVRSVAPSQFSDWLVRRTSSCWTLMSALSVCLRS